MRRVLLFAVLMGVGRIYGDLWEANQLAWCIALWFVAYLVFAFCFERIWIERSKVAESAARVKKATTRIRELLAKGRNVTTW